MRPLGRLFDPLRFPLGTQSTIKVRNQSSPSTRQTGRLLSRTSKHDKPRQTQNESKYGLAKNQGALFFQIITNPNIPSPISPYSALPCTIILCSLRFLPFFFSVVFCTWAFFFSQFHLTNAYAAVWFHVQLHVLEVYYRAPTCGSKTKNEAWLCSCFLYLVSAHPWSNFWVFWGEERKNTTNAEGQRPPLHHSPSSYPFDSFSFRSLLPKRKVIEGEDGATKNKTNTSLNVVSMLVVYNPHISLVKSRAAISFPARLLLENTNEEKKGGIMKYPSLSSHKWWFAPSLAFFQITNKEPLLFLL